MFTFLSIKYKLINYFIIMNNFYRLFKLTVNLFFILFNKHIVKCFFTLYLLKLEPQFFVEQYMV